MSNTMSQEQDSLGLDKPIKLGRVSKIPKITDELLMDRVRGLPHVINNYQKVAKIIRKNDRLLDKGKRSRQLKIDTEIKNLESVLEFYQLWCHGLFPKATFGDCIQMIRNYKSPRIRIYRRELVDQEIHRQRVEKGIITENDNTENQAEDYESGEVAGINELYETAPETNEKDVLDDDDWGFLSVKRRGNGLFIGDEDEDEADANTDSNARNNDSNVPPNQTINQDTEGKGKNTEEFPDMDDFDDMDNFDAELDVMREMGM